MRALCAVCVGGGGGVWRVQYDEKIRAAPEIPSPTGLLQFRRAGTVKRVGPAGSLAVCVDFILRIMTYKHETLARFVEGKEDE